MKSQDNANAIFQADTEFDSIKLDEKDFENTFDYGFGCFCRRVFFAQCLRTLFQNRRRYKEIQELKESGYDEMFDVQDIPGIEKEESMNQYSRHLNDNLKEILIQEGEEEITAHHMLKGLIKQFKWQMVQITLFFVGQSICRLGFSVLLYSLLLVLMDLQNSSFTTAYLLAFFSGVVWLIGQCFMHNAFFQVNIFTTKLRSSIMGLLFKKLSKLSLYMAKSQELGKLINMFSNDFNLIELKGVWFFPAFSAPIVIIGAIVLLITRLGWYGIICPVVILVLFPIQVLIGRLNGKILKKINIFKDERVKTCTEIIEGIKFIKLYGWEMAFKEIIQTLRKDEIHNFLTLSFVKSIERAFGNSIALWAGFICFLVMHFTGEGDLLNAANIFSTLQILVTLRLSLFYFGIGSGYYFEVIVILERYASIMNFKNERMIEIDQISKKPLPKNIEKDQGKGTTQNLYIEKPSIEAEKGQIIFIDFNGYWKTKDFENPNLKNINIHIKRGEFCGITGKVGSGKSGLLGVLLDEIPYYSGKMDKEGIISYVEQEPVLFSASVRDNILFGSEFNQERYNNALRDSCLLADLQLLQNGEDTIVGEKGITLSGGQKARMALARAIYIDADIYLFDDPISAVDSKVAKQIYERVVLKLWQKGKTVVLVTHQISYLQECDRVLIMEDGRVAHNDDPRKLKEELKKFQLSEKEQKMNEDMEEEMIEKDEENQLNNFLEIQITQRKRKMSLQTIKTEEKSEKPKIGQALREEDVDVTCSTYKNFISLSRTNYFLFPLTIIAFLVSEALNSLYFRFLAGYGDVDAGIHSIFGGNDRLYMGVLGLILFNHFILFIVKYMMFQMVILFSNQQLHKSMIKGLVRSPSSYFDITPTGRLTNKFSNDLGILDTLLGFIAIDALEGPIFIVVSMVNIFIIDLFFMIPGIINLVCLIVFFLFCNQLIINSKKLDLRMKNPVFSTVSEVISGLVQIKIFGRRKTLLEDFTNIVNDSYRSTMNFWYTTRIFGVYSTYVSLIILIIGFVLGVRNIEADDSFTSNSTLAGLYGVTVVFLLQTNDNVQWSLRQINFMESIMVSAQRSFVVKDLESQKQLRTNYDKKNKIRRINANQKIDKSNKGSNILPVSGFTEEIQEWPKKAILKFKNFSLRYRPQLPLVLKGISFTIQEGEKVGIVGRTGAGKSSIIQALFRIVEPEEGSIYEIDDCDALQLGLHTLRHRLSVIPQLPFLFKGDIKTNLDPFNKHSEETLWEALDSAGLKNPIQKLPEKLETNISNIAEVFSVGQKQLLCLARALLRDNKFLILDEATSNVDMETDYFIQNCIHTKFQNTTVITIAHRLNTIADYDKVIVMSRGKIIEIGSPYQLIQGNGLFAEMVSHTGKNADLIKKMAKSSFERKNRL